VNAKNGPAKGRSAITYTEPQNSKQEVADRLDAIGNLAAHALLGELPVDVVLEASIVLAHRAALFVGVSA